MKKTFFILSFILVSFLSFCQKQRTTSTFDADTTTRPKTGFYGIGVRSNNVYFIPQSGNNIRMANYSLFTGLTTNYLSKWNGSKLVNTLLFDSGTNVGIGTSSPVQKTHINTSLGGVPIGLYLTNDATNATLGRGVGVLFGGTGNTNLAQIESQTLTASNNTGGLIFKTANAGTLAEVVRIDQSGNFGVGITPSSKLHVNGNVLFENSNVYINTDNRGYWLASAGAFTMGIARSGTNMQFYNNSTIAATLTSSGSLGIGTTPDASAKLHISSTTQGVLITRGTTSEINAISSPANGLMVYNTTLNKLCVYENGSWKQVTTTTM